MMSEIEQSNRIAALEATLQQIAKLSAARDDWKPYDAIGYGSYYTEHGEQGVDPSNSGDIHSHGYACGAHEAAMIARERLNEPARKDKR